MKNRAIAILLAFFLGGLGMHHFYLGNIGRGVMYLLFCWTFIPGILALIDFFVLVFTNDEKFRIKYSR